MGDKGNGMGSENMSGICGVIGGYMSSGYEKVGLWDEGDI